MDRTIDEFRVALDDVLTAHIAVSDRANPNFVWSLRVDADEVVFERVLQVIDNSP